MCMCFFFMCVFLCICRYHVCMHVEARGCPLQQVSLLLLLLLFLPLFESCFLYVALAVVELAM